MRGLGYSVTPRICVDTIFGHVSLDTHLELMKRRSTDWAMVASLQESCRWRMVPMEKQVNMTMSRDGDADDQCRCLLMAATGSLSMTLKKSAKVAD